METDWNVRRANAQDLPNLQSIEAASFGQPWPLELLSDAVNDPKYLVLCLEEPHRREMLGYIAAWSVLDEGQIDRLAILPAQRRRGLGRVLLESALQGLAEVGVARIFLEVRAGNVGAIALYHAAGFETVGLRRAYYEDGEDAIVLRFGDEL